MGDRNSKSFAPILTRQSSQEQSLFGCIATSLISGTEALASSRRLRTGSPIKSHDNRLFMGGFREHILPLAQHSTPVGNPDRSDDAIEKELGSRLHHKDSSKAHCLWILADWFEIFQTTAFFVKYCLRNHLAHRVLIVANSLVDNGLLLRKSGLQLEIPPRRLRACVTARSEYLASRHRRRVP
jgi:hypothetical protein